MTPEEALEALEEFAWNRASTFDDERHVREIAATIRADIGVKQRVLQLWDSNDAWIPGADFADLADALGVAHKRTLTHRDGGMSRPGIDLLS